MDTWSGLNFYKDLYFTSRGGSTDWLNSPLALYKLSKDKVEEQEVPYDEQYKEAKFLVGFPGNEIEGDTALFAVALLCYLTQLYRKKNPATKPYHIICKIYGKPEHSAHKKWYMAYSLLCEMFLTPNAVFSTHGLTTVEEISNQIKEI